jgi:hypothetical protein
MSTIMHDSTITIEGFVVRQDDGTPRITYLENNSLTDQLLVGQNIPAGALDGVALVKLAVDETFNEIEVESLPGMNTLADTIDAAIESLIVVRDILRKGVTLEADLATTA